MKTKRLFIYLALLLMLVLGAVGCSSSDDEEVEKKEYEYPSALCKAWVLVSYGNESNEVLKESEGHYYEITFCSDGTLTGLAYYNEIVGRYRCEGNKITIDHFGMTKRYHEGSDPDEFFKEHLSDVSTYSVTNTELRLYYSKDEYFKFRIKK